MFDAPECLRKRIFSGLLVPAAGAAAGVGHFWTNDKKPYLCKRLTGTEVEDSTLIARVKAGDRGAFNELYGIYWASLVNYAGLFVGDEGAFL